MAWNKNTLPDLNITTQDENNLESFPITKIDRNILPWLEIEWVINVFRKFLREKKIDNQIFEEILNEKISENNIKPEQLKSVEFKNNTFIIYLKEWWSISFELGDIEKYKIDKVLNWKQKKEIEQRVTNIQKAIEKVIKDNNFIYNWEINDDDILEKDFFWDYDLPKDLYGKNLKQLKDLLNLEQQKLFTIYEISWETKKKQELLKEELKVFAAVWDKENDWDYYEGMARYASLSSLEIEKKVGLLVKDMNNQEIFDYMKESHKSISENYKKSDMVKQINWKFIDALNKIVFKKLKKENASNKDFIEFAKILTWRWKLEIDKNQKYEKLDEFKYDDLDIDNQFKAIDIANKAIIFIMTRKDWVIDNLKKKKEVEWNWFEDEELEWKEPKQIIDESKKLFDDIKIFGTSSKAFKNMWYEKYINITKPYSELTFEEKIAIWWLARLNKEISKLTIWEIKENPKILNKKIQETVKESYEWLNDYLSDKFDWFGGLFWQNADDLWLHWEMAEIFELYQDINWNWDLFDFSDNFINDYSPTLAWTIDFTKTLVIIWAALYFLPWTGLLAFIWKFAASWAANWLVTNIIWKQGYDSYLEAVIDTLWVMWIDAATWAFFWGLSIFTFSRYWINIMTEKFFSKYNFYDIFWFWAAESLTNWVAVTPFITTNIKKLFPESHFDTDDSNYHKKIK